MNRLFDFPTSERSGMSETSYSSPNDEAMVKPMPSVVVTEAYQLDGYKSPDWNDWKWYWSELAKDPYVLGAAWFTLGDWSFGEDNINIVNQLPGLSKAIASMPPRVSGEATL